MNNNKEKQLTIADFHSYFDSGDNIERLKTEEQFLAFINMQPPKEWLEKHPYIKDYWYLPIGRVEWLMKKIFKRWHSKILAEGEMGNSVYVRVRVRYFHPIYKEWEMQDGIAAQELQMKSGTSQLGKNAYQMALPIAESLAIKDACEKIGDIFGGNVSRKRVEDYQYVVDPEIMKKESGKSKLLEGKSYIPEPENIVYDVPPDVALYDMTKENGQKIYNMFCAHKNIYDVRLMIDQEGYGIDENVKSWIDSIYSEYLQYNS